MRRCLIAILMALALAFAAAGCGPPHIKVPAPHPHVPEQFHEYNDLRKAVNKYKRVEETQHLCTDDQGIPYSTDC